MWRLKADSIEPLRHKRPHNFESCALYTALTRGPFELQVPRVVLSGTYLSEKKYSVHGLGVHGDWHR